MRNLLTKVFDCIFPPHEDTLRVRSLDKETVKRLMETRCIDTIYVLSAYSSPDIRALIHEAKFHGNTQAYALLNMFVSTFFASYKKPIDLIIPIPLSRARMRDRGYNQVLEVLKASVSPIPYPIETSILKRTRNTRPQTELKREDRLHNLKNAFEVTNPEKIHGKHILLVDDVMTTGSTFRAATAAFLPHSPASIKCLAFAH